MARTNYSYQKYRREQAKKKKKEEKLQRKLEKKKQLEGAPGPAEGASAVGGEGPTSNGQADQIQ